MKPFYYSETVSREVSPDEKERFMKKWHIFTGIGLIAVTLIIIVVSLVYNYFLLPNYIAPVVEDVSTYVTREDVLSKLYAEAVRLHDEGIMDDLTYTTFLRAYSEHFRDDEAFAHRILAEREEYTNPVNEETALKTKYASHKVGIEIIKVNDGESIGKADTKYSDERNSNRVKAEDYVEAESILEKANSTEEPTDEPDIVKSAYDKLKSRMTAKEFSRFTKIMSKLDIGTLKTFIADKEGLKEYLHSRLSDEEYKEAVNLGYKYIYVFLEKE